VRRSFAGLLFGLAFACLSLAFSGWLLQRTAFNPDRTASMADVILEDQAIKDLLVERIVEAAASQLPVPIETVQSNVELAADIPAGQVLLAEILRDAHAHLIGQQSEPVQITGSQIAEITRFQAATELSPVILPVPQVRALSVTATVLRWLVPAMAIVGMILGVLGVFAHPEKSVLLRSLGFGLLLLAVLVALLGYVVPTFIVPALVDNVWEGVPRQLAADARPLLIGAELVLVGAGVGLLAGTGFSQRRRRYNAPVSTYRYSEDRRWS
jgi:hypothetical protein